VRTSAGKKNTIAAIGFRKIPHGHILPHFAFGALGWELVSESTVIRSEPDSIEALHPPLLLIGMLDGINDDGFGWRLDWFELEAQRSGVSIDR